MNTARHFLDPSDSMPHPIALQLFRDEEIIINKFDICLKSHLTSQTCKPLSFAKLESYVCFHTQHHWKKSLPFFTLSLC